MVENVLEQYLVDLNLAGHTAVVTGGSRGIGRATCLALAAHGAAVGVHYSASQAQATEVVEEIRRGGGRAVAIRGDLREADAPGRIVAEAAAALGPIDILFSKDKYCILPVHEAFNNMTNDNAILVSVNLDLEKAIIFTEIPSYKISNIKNYNYNSYYDLADLCIKYKIEPRKGDKTRD